MKLIRKVITPDEAKEILSKNLNNRNIKPQIVEQYSRDLLEGRWEEDNPQGCLIVISKDGILKDGQHRLAAICKSGISALWLVAICDDSVGYFDMQRKRTIGNYLQINRGLDKNCAKSYITSAVKIHLSVRNGYGGCRYSNNTEVADYIESHQGGLITASRIVEKGKGHALCRKASIFHAIYAALMNGVDEEELGEFCSIINSGFSSKEKDYPAIACRNLLFKADTRIQTNVWDTSGKCEVYIRRYLNNTCQKTTVCKPNYYYTNQLFEMERRQQND